MLQVAKLKEAFEDLREVDPEEGMPDGIAETAEDLVSAKVMNHLVGLLDENTRGDSVVISLSPNHPPPPISVFDYSTFTLPYRTCTTAGRTGSSEVTS